jgi:hypothetical protein
VGCTISPASPGAIWAAANPGESFGELDNEETVPNVRRCTAQLLTLRLLIRSTTRPIENRYAEEACAYIFRKTCGEFD